MPQQFDSWASFHLANPAVRITIGEKLDVPVYSDDNYIVSDVNDETLASIQLYDDADGEFVHVEPWGDTPDFYIRPESGKHFNR